MIDQGSATIDHARLDGSIVLTAPTKDLQAFVWDCAEGGAFNDVETLYRTK